MKWETSVSLTYFKYKTISRIIQFFVEDFVETLRDPAQTLFSDFVEAGISSFNTTDFTY